MNILAFLIVVYALVMILLHVFTGKNLKTWHEQPDSRIGRWFPPRLADRGTVLALGTGGLVSVGILGIDGTGSRVCSNPPRHLGSERTQRQ